MTKPINIGVLGFGYLGKMLHQQFAWSENSWATIHKSNTADRNFLIPSNTIFFEWDQPTTWLNLPHTDHPVLITIPPVLQERNLEKTRLIHWCEWMKDNRPAVKTIIYISSTGVYQDEAELWTEQMIIAPDTEKGWLRLDAETVLGKFFETRVIRAGAIYGPGRHIGLRVLNGQVIPQGQRPVHRIHVTDLARIVEIALSDASFPSIVNAVDLDPASSETAVNWLFQQGFSGFDQKQKIIFKEGYYSRKQQSLAQERFISNDLLVNKLKFRFQYPTYKEGLTAIVQQ